jgi:hypothetical protein
MRSQSSKKFFDQPLPESVPSDIGRWLHSFKKDNIHGQGYNSDLPRHSQPPDVHASKESAELRVRGQSFKDVCGSGQAFLRLSDSNSILFFVGGQYVGYNPTPVFLHVFNLKSNHDTMIRTEIHSKFDAWLDASKNDIAVEQYDSHKLIISFNRGGSPKYEFDLDAKRAITKRTHVPPP